MESYRQEFYHPQSLQPPLPLQTHMNVWQMVAITIFEKDRHKNPIKHAECWHRLPLHLCFKILPDGTLIVNNETIICVWLYAFGPMFNPLNS